MCIDNCTLAELLTLKVLSTWTAKDLQEFLVDVPLKRCEQLMSLAKKDVIDESD